MMQPDVSSADTAREEVCVNKLSHTGGFRNVCELSFQATERDAVISNTLR
jgi:hypothetical protein